MSSYISRGESVFFQFRNGKSVLNSQCKPRMFKTAEKATLGVNYIDTDDVVEYAEVKRGEWEVYFNGKYLMCSACKASFWDEDGNGGSNFCPNCGADMRSHHDSLCDQTEEGEHD